MPVNNSSEARARLCELVRATVRGEEVIIARAGKPPVRMDAIAQTYIAETERRAATKRALKKISPQSSSR